MRENESQNARRKGEPKIVNEEYYIGIISTLKTRDFYEIVEKYKNIRDSKKNEEIPKISMRNSLAIEFAKYKSKYQTKKRAIALVVNIILFVGERFFFGVTNYLIYI